MQVIRISLPDGSEPLDVGVDSVVERLNEFGQYRENAGKYNASARSPDIREARTRNIQHANSAWKGFDEALSIVLLKVYEAGYKAGKRSLDFEFYCDACDQGFRTVIDLAQHAGSDERCTAALHAKLNGKAQPRAMSLSDI